MLSQRHNPLSLMACNGVLTSPPKSVTPPVLKYFTPLLQLEMAVSAFAHGYFQQAHVHIPEATITD